MCIPKKKSKAPRWLSLFTVVHAVLNTLLTFHCLERLHDKKLPITCKGFIRMYRKPHTSESLWTYYPPGITMLVSIQAYISVAALFPGILMLLGFTFKSAGVPMMTIWKVCFGVFCFCNIFIDVYHLCWMGLSKIVAQILCEPLTILVVPYWLMNLVTLAWASIEGMFCTAAGSSFHDQGPA